MMTSDNKKWWRRLNVFDLFVVLVSCGSLAAHFWPHPEFFFTARLLRTKRERLALTIKSSGYFNAKAAKLAAVSHWYLEVGGLTALRERPLAPLRESLLEVWGVGPETADSILCYAAGRRTAVVDAYTRRILSRHGFLDHDVPYEDIRRWLEERLSNSQFVFEEFHALFARTGYTGCKPTPRCAECPATTPVALR